ncbi:unnamed protein product [Periconia digitata]|uniref:Uncharacterized protein n=1 Tax=Periconia digitata TaxID=1303443 RepID=A0A9W4UGV9_9PLEO|nr:unnamed protein product [Periconia digitata]
MAQRWRFRNSNLLTTGVIEALDDVRQRWRVGSLCFGILLWLLFLLGGVAVLASPEWPIDLKGTTSACRPDDTFSVLPAYMFWSIWSGSGLFQVTLGVGELSFSTAKAIDVAWDIFVGRGGQAVIGFISWRVMKGYVTTSMLSRGPVTFHTYRTIFLQDQSLVLAIPKVIRDFIYRRRLHSRFVMVCMISTFCFILVFPTLASAMTGYTSNMKAYVPDRDGNLMAFDAFRSVLFIVHDGSRINQTDEYFVTSDEEAGSNLWTPYSSSMNDLDRATCGEKILIGVPKTIHSLRTINWVSSLSKMGYGPSYPEITRSEVKNVSSSIGLIDVSITTIYDLDCSSCLTSDGIDVESFGYGGTNQTNSSFMMTTLISPPSLNITGFFLPDDMFSRYEGEHDPSKAIWRHFDDTYDLEYVTSLGTCQATKTYRWGFSFLLLYIMLCLLLVWTLAMMGIWLYAQVLLKKHGITDVSGEIKAVFELAQIVALTKNCKAALYRMRLRPRYKTKTWISFQESIMFGCVFIQSCW